MSTIALTLTASSVAIADGRGSLTASVTNGSTVPARIVLGAFGPVGAPATAPNGTAWTSIDRPLREIAAGATEQYSVAFAPPAGTASGSYPVRFIAYSADQAPEEHADQAKQVDVVIPAAPPAPPPKKPWWPYAVAAALVVVAGVVGWLVLRPDTTQTTTGTPSPLITSPSPTPMVTPTTPPVTTPANPCPAPYVPRLARPSDLTCVTEASAAEALFDNNPAVQAQRRAGGGPYGPDTCKQGWVWREAYEGDVICVTPETRARTKAENQPKYTLKQLPTLYYPRTFLPTILSTP